MTAVNLEQLGAELAAAGVSVPNGLCTLNDTLETVRTINAATGALIVLPPEAAPVLAAHRVAPPPAPLNFGSDLDPDSVYRAALPGVVMPLQQFLNAPNANITLVQVVMAVKLLIRMVFFLFRRYVS